jgi:hypothetical protein
MTEPNCLRVHIEDLQRHVLIKLVNNLGFTKSCFRLKFRVSSDWYGANPHETSMPVFDFNCEEYLLFRAIKVENSFRS